MSFAFLRAWPLAYSIEIRQYSMSILDKRQPDGIRPFPLMMIGSLAAISLITRLLINP